MWIDILLTDVNSRLTVGSMFSISSFDVCRCAHNFRLTDSTLMIRFSESTGFDELTKPVSQFPTEGFRFRNQTQLIGLANTSSQLPDIIGELTSVKSYVSDPLESKNHVMVTIKLYKSCLSHGVSKSSNLSSSVPNL